MEWLVQHIELLFSIIGALIGALATMAYSDMKRMKDKVAVIAAHHSADVEKVREEVMEVRKNYLDRFADMKDSFKKEIGAVAGQLTALHICLERDFLRKHDCPFIHKKDYHETKGGPDSH